MVALAPTKSGLERGAWIDRYNYQNKEKTNYRYEKNMIYPCGES